MKDLIEAKLGNRYITFKQVCLVLKKSAWSKPEIIKMVYIFLSP